MNFTSNRCADADKLRGEWYASDKTTKKAKLILHVKACQMCQQRTAEMTAMAEMSMLPEFNENYPAFGDYAGAQRI